MVTRQEHDAAIAAIEKEMGSKPSHLAWVALEAAENVRKRPSGLYDRWGEDVPMDRVLPNDSRVQRDEVLDREPTE